VLVVSGLIAVMGCRSSGERVSELDPADRQRLARQEAVVATALRTRYGAALRHTEDDLPLLQRLVDDKAFGVGQTYEWQCVGIALGQVLAHETPLRWVMVEDELGRDPALELPGTTVHVYPLTMVSKRVEQGRDIPIRALYIAVRDQAEAMRAEHGR
jgi:hypothetical protein